MALTTVSLFEVQARWGYSEIIGAGNSHHYDSVPNIDELRDKHRSGIPLDQLTPDEQYYLACLCASARINMLIFTIGVDRLVQVVLYKAQIRTFYVPPMVSGHTDFMTFEEYMNTTAADPREARNVQPSPGGYVPPTDPLTVGRHFNNMVLLDGYHRAASFWKYATADTAIQTYVPEQFVIAT